MKIISKLFNIPFLALFAFLSFNCSATLGAPTEAEKLINDLGERAIKSLTDGSQNSIDTTFLQLLDEGFDISYIAGFVMGRNWKSFSDVQKDEFRAIFRQRLKKTYAIRFKEYKGVNFKVKSSRTEGKRQIVQTVIQKEGGPATLVDWVVVATAAGYKIHDVVVEGISMSQTMRSDYSASYLREGANPEAFIEYLKR